MTTRFPFGRVEETYYDVHFLIKEKEKDLLNAHQIEIRFCNKSGTRVTE